MNMLMYIGWGFITMILFIVSIIFDRKVIFAFTTALSCFMLALQSGGIHTELCDIEPGSGFICYQQVHEEIGLMWWWYGLGFFMLAWGIGHAIWDVEDIAGNALDAVDNGREVF